MPQQSEAEQIAGILHFMQFGADQETFLQVYPNEEMLRKLLEFQLDVVLFEAQKLLESSEFGVFAAAFQEMSVQHEEAKQIGHKLALPIIDILDKALSENAGSPNLRMIIETALNNAAMIIYDKVDSIEAIEVEEEDAE